MERRVLNDVMSDWENVVVIDTSQVNISCVCVCLRATGILDGFNLIYFLFLFTASHHNNNLRERERERERGGATGLG